tara:strand:+ start:88 stop:714 length:627 start_codon:yes stop_codon:yes gene_type:complete
MSGKSKIDQRGSNPSHSPVFQDDRKGLGYGQTYPTGFNSTKSSQTSFPYRDPDPYEDDEPIDSFDDDELDIFIKKVNGDIMPTDFMAGNSTDRTYFVAGNTRGLTGVMESGVPVASNSISALPGWSKKIQATSGGYGTNAAFTTGPYKRTGTTMGYSHRPPHDDVYDPEEELTAFTIQDILQDDERILAKTKLVQDKIDRLNRLGNNV